MDQSSATESTSALTPQGTPQNESPQPNPYQRVASRRAIACVTCAKAKTKCDKGLPHCSRCISKGIKCQPRSTRRTSENNYRSNIKKAFVTPKHYDSATTIPSLTRHKSPRSMPLSRHQPIRAASHIDCRTAVKMSQQVSKLSGFPMLTPLPTYNPQVLNECRIDEDMSHQNFVDFEQSPASNSFPLLGCLTPQTPEATIYHEPLSMTNLTEYWMHGSAWSDDSIASVGLGLDSDMAGMLPADLWPTSELIHSVSITQMPWIHSQVFSSPQSMSSEFGPHAEDVPPSAIDYSVDEFGNTANFQANWVNCQSASSEINMANLVTSASCPESVHSQLQHLFGKMFSFPAQRLTRCLRPAQTLIKITPHLIKIHRLHRSPTWTTSDLS